MKSSRRSDTRPPLAETATQLRRRTLAFDAPSEEALADPVSSVRKRAPSVGEGGTPATTISTSPPPYSGTRFAKSVAKSAPQPPPHAPSAPAPAPAKDAGTPHRKTLPPPPFERTPPSVPPTVHPRNDLAASRPGVGPAEIALDAKVAEVFARYASTSRALRDHLQALELLIPRTSEGAVLRMLADRMLCELYAWASSHLGWAYGAALGGERSPTPPHPSPAMFALINEAIDGARSESASSPHYEPVFTALQKLDLELSRMIRLGHLLDETANNHAT
jgi:hypothetical protein